MYCTEWGSVDLMECSNLKYSVCIMCTHFVFIANCVLVYSLLPVELLIIEHLSVCLYIKNWYRANAVLNLRKPGHCTHCGCYKKCSLQKSRWRT